MSLHNDFLARLAPEFRIDDQEAAVLGLRLANYLRHTSVRMDPKTKDLYALIVILVLMEGPRIGRIRSRKAHERNMAKAEAAAREAGGAPNVIQMPAGPYPTH